ncbi:MAG TPA: glycosyltransferase family 39 protein, partial [Bryobacteraceae bacterium]|nr:glycosyltransferase family 39 protein [Bryobacteraceae bacterium]
MAPALRRLTPLFVLAAALAVLGIGIDHARVAETFSDPVGRFRSQDESLFTNSAITMALRGDWMTPKFLGRIYLFKPPLQFWVSAVSMKLLGISLFALRLPILIAGALGVVLLYDWGRRSTSVAGGLVIALLMLSDPMWHIFSRVYYTDMLATVFIAVALYFVARDSKLQKRASVMGFGILTATAI